MYRYIADGRYIKKSLFYTKMTVAPDVIEYICKKLRNDACFLYNPAIDIGSINAAFNCNTIYKPPCIFESKYYIKYAENIASYCCCHENLKQQMTYLQVIEDKYIDGQEFRDLIIHTHNNDPAEWLQCVIKHFTARIIPLWYTRLYLPLLTNSYLRHFTFFSNTIEIVKDYDTYYNLNIRLDDDILRRLIIRSGFLSHTFRFRLIDKYGTNKDRLNIIKTISDNNLIKALESLPEAKFIIGTVMRAREYRDIHWITDNKLADCVNYVLGINLEKPKLSTDDKTRSAKEMARSYKVAFGEEEMHDTIFERVNVAKRQRTLTNDFKILDMVVTFDIFDIVNVYDNRTKTDSAELPYIVDGSALKYRQMFDRRINLVNEFYVNSIDIEELNTRICMHYILSNEYIGPELDNFYSNLSKVVEICKERNFLKQKTQFTKYIKVLKDMRLSILASLYEARDEQLPYRFLILFINNTEYAKNALESIKYINTPNTNPALQLDDFEDLEVEFEYWVGG